MLHCYYICTTSLVKRRDEDGILKGFKGLVQQIAKRKRIVIGGNLNGLCV